MPLYTTANLLQRQSLPHTATRERANFQQGQIYARVDEISQGTLRFLSAPIPTAKQVHGQNYQYDDAIISTSQQAQHANLHQDRAPPQSSQRNALFISRGNSHCNIFSIPPPAFGIASAQTGKDNLNLQQRQIHAQVNEASRDILRSSRTPILNSQQVHGHNYHFRDTIVSTSQQAQRATWDQERPPPHPSQRNRTLISRGNGHGDNLLTPPPGYGMAPSQSSASAGISGNIHPESHHEQYTPLETYPSEPVDLRNHLGNLNNPHLSGRVRPTQSNLRANQNSLYSSHPPQNYVETRDSQAVYEVTCSSEDEKDSEANLEAKAVIDRLKKRIKLLKNQVKNLKYSLTKKTMENDHLKQDLARKENMLYRTTGKGFY